jgi:3-deoxy-7-phosphoheptulonate synthase
MLQTQDLHVVRAQPLAPPNALKRELPASDAIYQVVVRARAAVRDIIARRDHRLLAIVGPCSIHDAEAALDYAVRLQGLSERLAPTMFVVMRVYFEKPRTTIGWKGLISDPHLDGSYDMETGLRLARKLLLEINALGLPAGTELLDPIVPQYLADLISWTAIGARTTESQTHREMASGLSMPVGFKNRTDGNLMIAVNAMESAGHPHTFLGIDQEGHTAIVHTTGNPDRHVILRGGRTPNYDAESIRACEELLANAGLPCGVLVDCSHGQTRKDHRHQPEVLADLIRQIRAGNRSIMGFMLESNLKAGNQKVVNGRAGLQYGVSITDACIDWETTERCLTEAAAELQDEAAAARAGVPA